MKLQSFADPKIHHPHIDGLRGLAALLVLAVHLEVGPFHSLLAKSFVEAGARGVQLFFLISAFTLFRSLHGANRINGQIRVAFFIRRAFRILPLWWIATLVYALWEPYSVKEAIPTVLMYFGFIRYSPRVDVIPLGWSIFVEESFYLLLPWIAPLILSLKSAFGFVLLCILISAVWIKLGRFLGIPETNAFLALAPPSQWPALAGGIWLYFFTQQKSGFPYLTKWLSGWRLEVATIAALVLFVRSNFLIATLPMALVFLSAASGKGIFSWLTRRQWLQNFGICCYSIYLFHPLVIRMTAGPFQKALQLVGASLLPGEAQFLILFPLTALISLAIGTFSYRYLEYPSVRAGKWFIEKLKSLNVS